MVMNYFHFVAQEVRELMAKIGVRSIEELIGQTQYLKQQAGITTKQSQLDLQPLLDKGEGLEDKPYFCQHPKNPPWDTGELAEKMVAQMREAIDNKTGGTYSYSIRNTDRSIGARVSGEIARLWGNAGMEHAPLVVQFKGVAGQSFGGMEYRRIAFEATRRCQ